ncbi:MAG: FimV/HubP family polar landmark protein [Cocleimonas sp.]
MYKRTFFQGNAYRLSFIKTLAIAPFILLSPLSINTAFAESTYGPVKSGETLFGIAKKNQQSESTLSVKQLSIAIFNLNPNAFLSNNINLLKKGAQLKLPDTEALVKLSSSDAKAQFKNHTHALQVIRVEAKHLKQAKQQLIKNEHKVRHIQQQLKKSRQYSKSWLKLSKNLVDAKKTLKRSQRKVAKLSNLLIEKVTLKYTAPITIQIPIQDDDVTDAMANVDKRLNDIQASLDSFNKTNLTLIEKVQELSKLNDRVKVLEEGLGSTDNLVVQLKVTLEEMQKSIDEQGVITKKLTERFQELKIKNESKENEESASNDTPVNNNETETKVEDNEDNEDNEKNEKDDKPAVGSIEDYLES